MRKEVPIKMNAEKDKELSFIKKFMSPRAWFNFAKTVYSLIKMFSNKNKNKSQERQPIKEKASYDKNRSQKESLISKSNRRSFSNIKSESVSKAAAINNKIPTIPGMARTAPAKGL